MNFRDMTREEKREYDKIMRRSDMDWLLWNLAIFTLIFVIATLIILFA